MKPGLKLRLLRHHIQHDQHQMAEKLQISVAEYSKMECGLTVLTPELSNQMVTIFGHGLDETNEVLNSRNNRLN